MKTSSSTITNGASNSKKAKASKKKKQTDPNKPPRALNADNMFLAIQRQKLLLQQRTANGSLKHVKGGFDDLAWTVSERWRKLDIAYKAKLENLAGMDKDRHDREMKAWKAKKNLTSQERLNSANKSRDSCVKRGMANELTARIKEIAQKEAQQEASQEQRSEQDLMLANLLVHLSENPHDCTECQQNKQESQSYQLDAAANSKPPASKSKCCDAQIKMAGDVMAAVNLRFRYGPSPSENVVEAGNDSSECKQSKQDPILLKESIKDEMKSPSEQDAAATRTRVTPTLECYHAQTAGDAMTAVNARFRFRCDLNHNSLGESNLVTVCGPSENAAKPHKCKRRKRNLLLLTRIRRRRPHWPRKERKDRIGSVVMGSY
jgi:hypothetical protein